MGETPDWVPPQPPPWGPWGGGAAAPPPDYKPGIVPLRPLSVGEILDGGFATIRRNPRIVFGFAFALAALVQLARLGLGWGLSDVGGTISSSLPRSADGSRLVVTTGGLTATVASFVIGQIFAALLAGVVTSVVGKAILGERPDGRETVRAVATRWWPLLWVSIVAGGLPYAPVLFVVLGPLGIIPAAVLCVYLWGKLALAVPALVLERLGVGRSIGRSWQLVRGAFWRVWGLRALAWLIVGIAGTALAVPFGFTAISAVSAGHLPSTSALVLATIGNGVVWMLTQPFLAAATTLIYVDRRMRAEGLDIQLTQAARAGAAASSTPPASRL
jgi:MFS family permease